ncbi:TPA_asm: hypothetical protein [Porphyromonas phage phage006a_EM3]|uniref:Uncharacterized protein n=1 Tax=Porphyromonas phage phage006a_EM3 TaxID=3154098 RepID=A0AAT9JBA7_9CAUD
MLPYSVRIVSKQRSTTRRTLFLFIFYPVSF